MNNVISIPTGNKPQQPKRPDETLQQVCELLEGTIERLNEGDGSTDICDLTLVTRIKDLLDSVSHREDITNAIAALSHIELVRLALADPDKFKSGFGLKNDDGEHSSALSFGHSVATVLGSALILLEDPTHETY